MGRSGGHRGGLHILLHTGMWRVSFPFYSTCFARLEFQVVTCRSVTAHSYSFSLGFSQYKIFFGKEHLVLRYGLQMKFSFHLNHCTVPPVLALDSLL